MYVRNPKLNYPYFPLQVRQMEKNSLNYVVQSPRCTLVKDYDSTRGCKINPSYPLILGHVQGFFPLYL